MAGFLRYVAIVSVFAVLAALFAWHPWGSSGATTYVADTTDAKVICQQFVQDKLKAPTTANFAPYSAQTATVVSAGTFDVQGYVDAQNSFGANLRTTYQCRVRAPVARDGTWSLLSLSTSP